MKFGAIFRVLMFFIAITLCVTVPGWAQSGSQANSDQAGPVKSPALQPLEVAGSKAHDSSFVIGNNDVLAISVWKEPELSKTLPVRSDGKITLPLVGEMQASGRTPLQLEGDITAKLRSFINTPEVSVLVQQVNSMNFNILGEVAKPGSYSVSVAPTVMDAIAAAGGFRDFAKKSGVYVLRKGPDGHQIRLNFNYKEFVKGKSPDQNVKLQPNDSVIVP